MSFWKEQPIWETDAPWNLEQIYESTFRDRKLTQKTIDRLTGANINRALEEVRLSLSIFIDSIEDLLGSISTFKGKTEMPDFWDRTRRQEKDLLTTKIQRGVFCSSVSAMALVDHTRVFTKEIEIKGCPEKIRDIFSNNPEHKFIHSMRRFVTHVGMTQSNWKIVHEKHGKSIFFILGKEELLRWGDWSSLAKRYIESHEEGINVEKLFSTYSKSVRLFHDWLRSQVWETYHSQLEEYHSAHRMLCAVGSRVSWNLLLKQVFEPQKIDPYSYLGRYLEKDELEQVLALPYRSKIQVDKIIGIVDEFGACDDELRKEIYNLFGVRS